MIAPSEGFVRMVAVATSDGAGGTVRGWAPGAFLWGEMRLRAGNARGGEWGPVERVSARVRAHWVPAGHAARPEAGDRLRGCGRDWEVLAAAEAPGRRHLLLYLAAVAEEAA